MKIIKNGVISVAAIVLAMAIITLAATGSVDASPSSIEISHANLPLTVESSSAYVTSDRGASNSTNQSVYTIHVVYVLSNSWNDAQIGNSISTNYTYGFIQIIVAGHTINLIQTMDKNKMQNASNSDPPGFYYFAESGFNWEAGLAVAQIPVTDILLDTLAQALENFAETVAALGATVIVTIPESAPVVALMLTAIAVDYAALYADALYEGMSTIYFEIGGSQGTLWWDPILAGGYAEEGLYDGPYNQPNLGFPYAYYPVWCNSLNSNAWNDHPTVWNPVVPPPWGNIEL